MNDFEAKRELINGLTERVIGASIAVHKALGPGLLESAYEECLCYELSSRGVQFERQCPLPIEYGAVRLDCGYRLDVVVEDLVLVELKAVDSLLPIHEAQLLTYLKLARLPVGLLINFNTVRLREGIKRRLGGTQPWVGQRKTSAPSVSSVVKRHHAIRD